MKCELYIVPSTSEREMVKSELTVNLRGRELLNDVSMPHFIDRLCK